MRLESLPLTKHLSICARKDKLFRAPTINKNIKSLSCRLLTSLPYTVSNGKQGRGPGRSPVCVVSPLYIPKLLSKPFHHVYRNWKHQNFENKSKSNCSLTFIENKGCSFHRITLQMLPCTCMLVSNEPFVVAANVLLDCTLR